jgi:coenzyme Q-binding protein COQ10
MPSFETSRRVRHTAAQMFALVADIEAYPQFLPLCRALRVTRRSAEGEKETLVADMEVGYKAIRETFTSRVVCERPLLKILVNYIDGPFKHLENTWRFRDIEGQGSQVEFHITYEFKNRMLSLLVGGMFDTAFRKFAEAFERRADQVYGRL